jgi:hypothetical protein
MRRWWWFLFMFILSFFLLNIFFLSSRKKQIFQRKNFTVVVKEIKQINIFVSTLKRNETKYEYLKREFSSFSSLKEHGIHFNFIAFERQTKLQREGFISPDQKDENFKHEIFQQLKFQNQFKPRNTRESSILNQTLDFISMFKKIKHKCKSMEDVFLYMEDDFTLCPDAFWHFLSIYKWGLNHVNLWSGIRFSIGFSGIMMQCRDIDSMLNTIQRECLKQPIPIDMIISNWWNPLNGITKE